MMEDVLVHKIYWIGTHQLSLKVLNIDYTVALINFHRHRFELIISGVNLNDLINLAFNV